MHIEGIREYCLSLKGVTESFPFGDDTLVFKVLDKIFALVNLEGDLRINLKCDSEKALELREQYNAVQPGYHMNKIIILFNYTVKVKSRSIYWRIAYLSLGIFLVPTKSFDLILIK